MRLFVVFLLLISPSLVAAHEKGPDGGERHLALPVTRGGIPSPSQVEPRLDDQGFEIVEAGPSQEVLERINQEYLSRIRPIFREKCFDCHSSGTRFPWYHKLPGARQLIDRDIREGRKHIDMTRDFPFEGHHGTPIDNLKALEKVIHENRMPLWRYRLLHWGSGLSTEEKDKILKWIRESQTIINQP